MVRPLAAALAVFLVSIPASGVIMSNRPGHDPTEESNEQVYRFLEHVLGPGKGPGGR